MARLPDSFDLGTRPIPNGRRPIVGVRAGIAEAAKYDAGMLVANGGDQMFRAAAAQAEKDARQADQLNNAKAQALFLKGEATLRTSFADDQDYATQVQRYQEGVQALSQQAAALITDPAQRELFAANAEVDIARGLSAVQANARGLERENQRAALNQDIADLVHLAVQAQGGADQQRYIQSIDELVQSAVLAGYVDPEEAGTLTRTATQDIITGHLGLMSPEDRLAALQVGVTTGDDGARRFGTTNTPLDLLDPVKRAALLDDAQADVDRARKQREAEQRAALAIEQTRLNIQINDAIAAAKANGADPFDYVPVDKIVSTFGEDAVAIVQDMQAAQAVGTAQNDIDNAFASGGPAAVTELLNQTTVEGANARNELQVQDARTSAAKSLVFDTALQNQLARISAGQDVDPAFDGLARAILGDPAADRLKAGLDLAQKQYENSQAIDGATLDELYNFAANPEAPPAATFTPAPASMTPQERALLTYHRDNLSNGTFLQDEQGITTLYSAIIEGPGGKQFLVPGYWDGKRHDDPQEIAQHAESMGWENLPSYDTVAQAESADAALHDIINKDTAAFERASALPGGPLDPSDPQYSDRLATNAQLQEQAVNTIKALTADPFSYVARNADKYDGVTDAMAVLSDPAADPAATGRALDTIVAAQRQALGPGNERFVSVMSQDRAASFVGELQAAPPVEWPTRIAEFVGGFGQYQSRAVADLIDAGMPAEARVFAFYGDDQMARPQLTRLATLLDEGGKTALMQAVKATPQAAAVETVPAAIAGALQEFNLTLSASGSGGGVETANAISSAVELLVLDDMRRGIDPTTSAQAHAAALVNDRYNFVQSGDSTYRVDARYTVDKVEGVATETLQGIQPADLLPVGGVPAGISDTDARQALYNAVQTGGRWVTNESDDGIVLLMPSSLGGLPVLRSDGSRIEVLFADAEKRNLDDLPQNQAGGPPSLSGFDTPSRTLTDPLGFGSP